jgi:pectinesterase
MLIAGRPSLQFRSMMNRNVWLAVFTAILHARVALATGGIVNGISADIIVAQDGSGDFKTVQQAIDSIPPGNTAVKIVYIKTGSYHEKIHIKQPFVHLIGADAAATILTYDDFAKKIGPTGKPLGTFGSLSVSVTGNDFEADNITFENPAVPRKAVAQTVALGVDSDRAVFRNCRMLANQDTLYANSGRQYYDDCFIRGDVDFIFGNAAAVFDHCEIQSSGKGYITAQSRIDDSQTTGYVLTNCKLTAAAGVPDGSVYLGRPWRPHARVVYLHCDLGPQINPAGWLKWRPTDHDMKVFYAEYDCTGPGAATNQRVAWSRQLTKPEAQPFEMETFLKGSDDWKPWRQNQSATRP